MKVKMALGVCASGVAALSLGYGLRKVRDQAGADERATVHAEPAQAACPVTGKAVDESLCAVHSGKCIYFCSQACVKVFAKDPEKHIKKLKEQGVVLEDASSCTHLDT